MSIKERKMRFIEKYVALENERLLDDLDALINKPSNKENKPSVYNLLGVLSHEDAAQMKKVIEENCENINSDDWN